MPDLVTERKTLRCDRKDALAILKRLRECGHVAYFAGGCVRDSLLGLTPKDWDVATDAPPDRVRAIFINTQAVGAAFGVILVRYAGSVVEVATFRSDGTYLDGRHPSKVQFTTPEEDAKRRDFTINGLFLDPIDDRVIDYVGGQADLREKRIRAIGTPAQRFDEDSLRLLRAVRFSARLGFEIEPITRDAIRAHAPQLKRISPERIAEELRIMLTAPTRPAAWAMLWDLRLIGEIFRFLPECASGAITPMPMLFPKLAPGHPIPFGLALAAAVLCYTLQTAAVEDVRTLLSRHEVQMAVRALRKSLKISNDESGEMAGTLEGLPPLLTDFPPTVAQKKRFLATPTAPLSRQLMEALASIGICGKRISELREDLIRLAATDFAPTPLLNGDDLTSLGLTPGPAFKRILDKIYDAQLEGRISTREEAISLGQRIAGRQM